MDPGSPGVTVENLELIFKLSKINKGKEETQIF